MTGSLTSVSAHACALRSYLGAARISIDAIRGGTEAEIHLAHFAQTSFAFVTVPRVSITWHRTPDSRGRAAILVARHGEFRVASDVPAVVHGTSAALITPGDSPVRIETLSDEVELIYVSIAAGLLSSELGALAERVERGALPFRQIAPIYGFVRTLTEPASAGSEDPRAELATPAEAMATSLARILGDGVTGDEGVLSRLHAFLDIQYGDADLTLGSVATRLGSSSRTVQAALTRAGSTFTEELRRRRVWRVESLRRSRPELRAEDLRIAAGFRSTSAMYRALRNYAESTSGPGDVSAEARSDRYIAETEEKPHIAAMLVSGI
ncbi:hypothetical protein [Mycetocola saprophilus]|uniref:hypothetical protein n=1 Tax=Mycetocola saprophilus TaxID=76636 RepID=UPI0004C2AEF4|nr:hypothetical protein [Mycetocola saprophilus]